MVMGRPLAPLDLTESDREQLESIANSRSLPHGLVRRAEIVLLAADGWPNEAVAAAVGVTRATVGKWRQRFLKNRLTGLHDELRPGAPRSISDEQVAEVVYKTLRVRLHPQSGWPQIRKTSFYSNCRSSTLLLLFLLPDIGAHLRSSSPTVARKPRLPMNPNRTLPLQKGSQTLC